MAQRTATSACSNDRRVFWSIILPCFSSFSMPARSPTHASHSNTGIFSYEVIHLQPYVFYPDKPIKVQITVNHIDTSDKSFVHDAAVSWVENTNYDRFTACVMAAGLNERESSANVTIDWVAYQGAPVGGLAGEKRISQWWTGTTCVTVNFPSVSS